VSYVRLQEMTEGGGGVRLLWSRRRSGGARGRPMQLWHPQRGSGLEVIEYMSPIQGLHNTFSSFQQLFARPDRINGLEVITLGVRLDH
jgi:hypothetical protein